MFKGHLFYMDIQEYLKRIKSAESGGNRFAVNKGKGQTASGLYQFTKSTWEGLGYNWADRFNTEKQEEAVAKFTKNNIEGLKKVGVKEPTYSDLYGAHFLGLEGYKQLLSKSDDTPVSSFIKDSTIKVNPNMLFDPKTNRPFTVGEVKNKLAVKVKESPNSKTSGVKTEPVININSYKVETHQEVPDLSPSQEEVAMNKLNEESYKRDKVDAEVQAINNSPIVQNQYQEQQIQKPQKQFVNAVQAQEIEYVPLYQDGGAIPISSRGMYDYPNQQVIVPTNGSITMKGIDYPILGESLDTGESIVMQPNKEYFFKNTKKVLETPLK